MPRRYRDWLNNARRSAGVLLLATGIGGCALLAPQTAELSQTRPAGLPARVEQSGVPFFPQTEYQCGPAALATVLANAGVNVLPEDLVEQVYLPGRKGSLQVEMLAAARRYGMVSYPLRARFEDLLREIAAGHPVVVLQDYGVWPFRLWHYAVVVGYDYEAGEVVLRSGEKRRLVMPFAVLEYTWKESDFWAMVVLPPGRLPVTAIEERYLPAVNAMARVAGPSAAESAYEAFLARWPDNLRAGVGLANARHSQKKFPQAEAVLRSLAERHPQSVAVLNNLAQTLSDQGRNDEALQWIERAAALGGPLSTAVQETRESIQRRIEERR